MNSCYQNTDNVIAGAFDIGSHGEMRSCETCRFGGHGEKGCMQGSGTPRYAQQEGCPLYAMSAQAFMQRVSSAQRRVVHLEEVASRYRDMALGTTARTDAIRVKGSISRGRVSIGMDAYMDICRDITREAEKLRGYMNEAMTAIGRLTDAKEREVLELRYLSGKSWQDMAIEMDVNERTVRRIHVKALEHIQREMDVLEYAKHRPGWNPGGAGAAAMIQ